MPPFLPPPPQIATVRPEPASKSTPSHFRDLSPAQAHWLEVLEQNGILHTNPEAEMFGPQQSVRRDELLMSEARLVELMLKRERQQQATLEKLTAEVAQLRSANTAMATTLSSLRSAPSQLLPPKEPAVPEKHEVAPPITEISAVPEKHEVAPPITEISARHRGDATSNGIDVSSLLRHRHRLSQFPRLQGFLRRASQLDPNDADYESYLQTYLYSAGMTRSLLSEATRQAAWLDAQGIA
ncbi:MAG: hypothetical protein H7Y37_03420 [Anaerolineae bacterium]|nr:hypothetical protein [Gloeobacterales cyanobacterium ES-bin-313]